MDQKIPEDRVAALWIQYVVITKMTGVYSNYFENEVSLICTMWSNEILKNPTVAVNQEDPEVMVLETMENIRS